MDNEMPRLISFYEEKKSTLFLILNNTQKHEEAIKNQDISQLEDLLSERQVLMRKVDEINNLINDLYQGNPSNIKLNNVRIESKKAECKKILGQIILVDEKNNKLFKGEYLALKQKITDIKANNNLRNAYYPSKQSSFGYFVDLKK
ncbi:hypothetical protein P6N53_14120 [Desulforamulus aquiferis]|uniref:FlgN protein n=1 Tax=Desulforamulus aquiferis TaxID=1397668 RepID=A0AAW7ZEZ7_9FIRM|nr:hypothetical protein [Desulforamulus aquiferis]RYD03066.1 hypothetical protein N752_21895 [Desulforamulus aquiferis]